MLLNKRVTGETHSSPKPGSTGTKTTTCTGVAGRNMSSLVKALEDPRMKGFKIHRTTAMSEPGHDWNFIDAVGRTLLWREDIPTSGESCVL